MTLHLHELRNKINLTDGITPAERAILIDTLDRRLDIARINRLSKLRYRPVYNGGFIMSHSAFYVCLRKMNILPRIVNISSALLRPHTTVCVDILFDEPRS